MFLHAVRISFRPDLITFCLREEAADAAVHGEVTLTEESPEPFFTIVNLPLNAALSPRDTVTDGFFPPESSTQIILLFVIIEVPPAFSHLLCVESIRPSRILSVCLFRSCPGVSRLEDHHARVCVRVRIFAGGPGGLELPDHLLLHLQDARLQEHRLPAGGGQCCQGGGGSLLLLLLVLWVCTI